MEEFESTHAVLYWYAEVDFNSDLIFHLLFGDDHDVVCGSVANEAMNNAKYLLYPIICLN